MNEIKKFKYINLYMIFKCTNINISINIVQICDINY